MKRIMFVCTGNICRSAIAEVLLKEKIKKQKLDNEIEAYSSGVMAINGDHPLDTTVDLMQREYNIDLNDYRAKHITSSHIENMDLILVMTLAHKLSVSSLYPELKDKIYVLKEYVGYEDENIEIQDPYGQSYEVYKECARVIDECIDKLIKKEISK